MRHRLAVILVAILVGSSLGATGEQTEVVGLTLISTTEPGSTTSSVPITEPSPTPERDDTSGDGEEGLIGGGVAAAVAIAIVGVLRSVAATRRARRRLPDD